MPHDGVLLPREDQRVGDQVRERELGVAARGGEGGVDARALGLECRDRELPEGRRRGDAEGLFHVGSEPRGRTFDFDAFSGVPPPLESRVASRESRDPSVGRDRQPAAFRRRPGLK